MWGFSRSLWRGHGSLVISRGDLGFIFYPVITSHWCHYRKQQRNSTSLFPISVYLLSFPLCFSFSLSDWSACLCIHPLVLSHSTAPSSSFTVLFSPYQYDQFLCVIFPHLLLPSSSCSFRSSFPTSVTLLSAPPKKCWQTCFWNGFSLWKIPLVGQSLRVTKRAKIPCW